MSVIPKITLSTVKISKYFYKAICLSLRGEAMSTMSSYIEIHQRRGIEYYHQLKHIPHPLWIFSDHSTNIITFYQLFRYLKTVVDTYAAIFKQWILEMIYTGIMYNSDRLHL